MSQILNIFTTDARHEAANSSVVSTRTAIVTQALRLQGQLVIPQLVLHEGVFIHDGDPHRQQTVFCNPPAIKNLAPAQTIILNAFNQHYSVLTLLSVDVEGAGISVNGSLSGSLVIGASKPYQVILDETIPGGVQGSIVFNFLEIPPVTVPVSATAYPVLWGVPPQTGMIKALEWKTSVTQTTSVEQRIGARLHPIVHMNHRYLFNDTQLAYFRNQLESAKGSVQSIPVWTDVHTLVNPTLGETRVYFDTELSYMRAGDTVTIFNESGYFEQNSVLAVLHDGAVLANAVGLATAHGFIGTVIYSRALSGAVENRNAQQDTIMSVAWYSEEYLPPVVQPMYSTYRGMMVVTDCRVMPSRSVADSKKGELIILTNGIGRVDVRQDSLWERDEYTLGFVFNSILEERQLEAFFHYVRGRQRQFFIPTNITYLEILEPLEAGSSNIVVTANNHALNSIGRFIEMRFVSGEFIRLRILAAEAAGVGMETITVDTVFSATIPPENVHYVTELVPVRLNSDRVEFSYRGSSMGSVNITAIACPETTDQSTLTP